jgi:acyl-CoA carboxylase subunit beta
VIDLVLDPDSLESWDEPIDISRHSEAYRHDLLAARARSGVDESVLTGHGRVHGRPVAVVVNEFAFLGGSIGVDAARRITAAVRRATARGLPLMASTSSGGTRMQEGTVAFVEMVAICRALMDHRAAGLPYLVHLRHPTTGGVYASWGSLGHVTVAEPGALVGFLGPKVYEALRGKEFPAGVQSAENLAAHGVIDGVVSTPDLRALVERTLRVLVDPPAPSKLTPRAIRPPRDRPAWESIGHTREAGRAGVRDLLRCGASDTVRLRGTEAGEHDTSIFIALTRLAGQPCVIVGQDRSRQTTGHEMGPAALREAARGMRLAEDLGLPLVTVIDTPGAELSPRAEEGALAGEIARCIAALTTLRVPSVTVLLGQGCGGGALALLPADIVVAAEHAWLAPLPPEGASVIVYGDVSHAAEVANRQRVRARDLLEAGVVQQVVPEIDGESADSLAIAVAAACGRQLAEFRTAQPRVRARGRRVQPAARERHLESQGQSDHS